MTLVLPDREQVQTRLQYTCSNITVVNPQTKRGNQTVNLARTEAGVHKYDEGVIFSGIYGMRRSG